MYPKHPAEEAAGPWEAAAAGHLQTAEEEAGERHLRIAE